MRALSYIAVAMLAGAVGVHLGTRPMVRYYRYRLTGAITSDQIEAALRLGRDSVLADITRNLGNMGNAGGGR
ncbi:Putative membrane protein [Sphingopyxis fribergensis]|uniref:Putative membrane protein n=1 Tax=Sphingopyxis fribergensis TaxID=1515612 RepID=A0A0A7PE02_9SPHN|nr:hypothetical protein [Sphingopyxis fribergensis]AJA07463.1 Putative membrane protein [Sphingopyxis fribergensis]